MKPLSTLIIILFGVGFASCVGTQILQDVEDLGELPNVSKGRNLVHFPNGRYDFWIRDTITDDQNENGQQVSYLKEDFLNSTLLFFDEGVFLQISPFHEKTLSDSIKLTRVWLDGIYYFGFYSVTDKEVTLRYRTGNGFENFGKRQGDFRVYAELAPDNSSLRFTRFEAGRRDGLPGKIPNEVDLTELFAVQELYELKEEQVHLTWWRADLEVTGFKVDEGKIVPVLNGQAFPVQSVYTGPEGGDGSNNQDVNPNFWQWLFRRRQPPPLTPDKMGFDPEELEGNN